MSDLNLAIQRQIQALQDDQERFRKPDVSPLYLPWHQRVLNPFPLASSGQHWGDIAEPWSINVLAFYCTVFVNTTNNGTNFWTIDVLDNVTATVVASVTTSASSANTWTRLSDLTITQPASTTPSIGLRPTATLSPGSIYIVPALALLRTGN